MSASPGRAGPRHPGFRLGGAGAADAPTDDDACAQVRPAAHTRPPDRALDAARADPSLQGRGRTQPPRDGRSRLRGRRARLHDRRWNARRRARYRLFVLLPLSLFLVAGIGIYADVTDLSTSEVVSRAGLPGLISGEIAQASSDSARWTIFVVTLPALVPGAALVGIGMLLINSFNVYVTTRMVTERIDTYGALGVAAALLFSLYLVGRVVVGSAVLNATVVEQRARASGRSA